MPQATTLGSPGKAVTFDYMGSVTGGVVIRYDYGDISVISEFFSLILNTFRGKTVPGGFSKTSPNPNGFGAWVQDNSNDNIVLLTPQHASRIAAILVAEKYAKSYRDGNAVILEFAT